MDQFSETLRSLLALDDVLEEGFLVVEISLVQLLFDAREYVLWSSVVCAIGVDNGSRGRLLFQEWFFTQVAIRGESRRFRPVNQQCAFIVPSVVAREGAHVSD